MELKHVLYSIIIIIWILVLGWFFLMITPSDEELGLYDKERTKFYQNDPR